MNQAAQTLASQGRYGDSVLVHMSPQEVGGLQALARNNGTSLTINPSTGLPEAFSLRNLLPMVAGMALGPAGMGLSALQAGMIAGGLGALATGSLREGLMMGLGAAGGAGMAGSMANLAAPAASAALPANAVVGAPGAMAGAGSGITIPTAAISNAAPGQLVNSTFMPQVGLNAKAMALPSLETAAGSINYGFTTPVADAAADHIGSLRPSTQVIDVNTLPKTPTMDERFGRVVEGGKQVFSSPKAFMDFAGNNKMNLAMGAAPVLFGTPEQEKLSRQDAFIRPYSLDVENLSGLPASPSGIEQERLRYRYTAGTPYRAAQGGIIAFAEGGNTTDGQEVGSNPVPTVSPEVAKVYESIARVQGMAGLPQLQVPAFAPSQPSPVIGIANQPISYRERNYGIPMPRAESSESYSATQQKKSLPSLPQLFDMGGGGIGDISGPSMNPNPASQIAVGQALQSYGRGGFAPGGMLANLLGNSLVDAGVKAFSEMEAQASMNAAAGQAMNAHADAVTAAAQEGYAANADAAAGAAGAAAGAAAGDGLGYGSGGYGGEGDGSGGFYAKGGQAKEIRKNINRMEEPYKFADYRSGKGLYESAQQNFAGGGLSNIPRFLSGGGDGMSDSIPATINDRQPARLADGEFVIPADVVSHLGNGSSKAGAKQLYAMMDRVRRQRTGKKKQAPAVNPKKMMPV